jgi:hypothetical protein
MMEKADPEIHRNAPPGSEEMETGINPVEYRR